MIGGAGGSMTVAKGRDLPLGWHVNAPFWGPRQDLEAVVDLARRDLIEAESRSYGSARPSTHTDGCATATCAAGIVVVPDQAAVQPPSA